MNNMKYSIWNLNPGYDQWHIIKKEQTLKNVNRADKVLKRISGKGLNVSRLLHNLNFEEYECINLLGGVTGTIISLLSKREMLNCLDYCINEESRINFCIMDEHKGKVTSYNDPGPMISKIELHNFIHYLEKYIEIYHDSAIVISGAPCRGFEVESFQKLLKKIFDCGNKIIVDVAGIWLKAAVEYPISILKVNREEFFEAFRIDAFIFTENLKRFKEAKKIDILIVTDGANGCVVYDPSERGYYGKMEGIQGGIYAVGSGDCFLGGYLLKYAGGCSVEECIVYANACGLANTFVYEPAMICHPAIMELEKYSRITELNMKEV